MHGPVRIEEIVEIATMIQNHEWAVRGHLDNFLMEIDMHRHIDCRQKERNPIISLDLGNDRCQMYYYAPKFLIPSI